jgi:hypothetical protein
MYVIAAGIKADCNDPFVKTLEHGLGTIISVLMGLGVAIAVIGIVVGGLMRATAWGSEQRIATSNKAITCAVIGLVIVLLGVTLGGQIPAWFGDAKGSCKVLLHRDLSAYAMVASKDLINRPTT